MLQTVATSQLQPMLTNQNLSSNKASLFFSNNQKHLKTKKVKKKNVSKKEENIKKHLYKLLLKNIGLKEIYKELRIEREDLFKYLKLPYDFDLKEKFVTTSIKNEVIGSHVYLIMDNTLTHRTLDTAKTEILLEYGYFLGVKIFRTVKYYVRKFNALRDCYSNTKQLRFEFDENG